ncbi:hypothetical protein LshimejAT787_0900090 [Lyophyllum shimeji]|uniref:Uncharacterized protein n=1 Tax=Lyophyllum shimeji TaxID=47721 RepID=A0A9P3UMS7_LYOSH|nr:hypothetical protein LshimejAT787_0900090 [Lyophyllum shimeji]
MPLGGGGDNARLDRRWSSRKARSHSTLRPSFLIAPTEERSSKPVLNGGRKVAAILHPSPQRRLLCISRSTPHRGRPGVIFGREYLPHEVWAKRVAVAVFMPTELLESVTTACRRISEGEEEEKEACWDRRGRAVE